MHTNQQKTFTQDYEDETSYTSVDENFKKYDTHKDQFKTTSTAVKGSELYYTFENVTKGQYELILDIEKFSRDLISNLFKQAFEK